MRHLSPGVLLLLAAGLSACTCATTAGVLYACEDGGGCPAGQACQADRLCHPADGGDVGPIDAGPGDGGQPDADLPDAGAADAGGRDGGTADGGGSDGGAVDAGPADAGKADAGLTDAGVPDAGPRDGGPGDGGAADAGPVDAGCLALGAKCASAAACCLPLCLLSTCQSPTGACGAAQELVLGTTSQELSGQLTGVSQAGGASCALGDGPEAVYAFTTTTATTPFSARVAFLDGGVAGLGPALYLRSTCQSAFGGPDTVCASLPAVGQAQFATVLPPGTWFLFVDSPDGGAAPYTLTVLKGSDGDGCGEAQGLVLADAGPLSAAVSSGDTALLGHDVLLSCAPATNAKDALVPVTVDRSGTLKVTLKAAWDAALSVRSGSCLQGVEAACQDLAGTGNETLSVPVTPGTWSVWISGHTNGDKGPYTLEVSLQ